jgi:hypothetical protein
MRKLAVLLVLVGVCAFTASASAATLVKVGETAPADSPEDGCTFCDDYQVATAAGVPGYSVPAGDSGVITLPRPRTTPDGVQTPP